MNSIRPILLGAALAALALPAAAQAGTLSVEGTGLRYTAGPGETNSVFVTRDFGEAADSISIGDAGGTVEASDPRCAPTNGGVRCSGITGTVVVELGDGNDSASQPSGDNLANRVEIHGGAGDDTLKAPDRGTSSAVLFGDDGNDTLTGGEQGDELRGGAGNDTLDGKGGPDRLYGEDGDDTLDGDTFLGPSADVLDGGAGVDRVKGWTGPSSSDHPPVSVTLDGAANDGRGGEGDNVTDVEQLTSNVSGTFAFSDAADTIDVYANLDGGASTIRTLGGNDAIRGGNYAETIDAGAGDDRIDGGFGDDTITGGPGRDVISGDRVEGQCGLFESCSLPQGNDTIYARDGEADSVSCGVGADTAIVDALDKVSADCEKVDVGTATAAGGGAPAAAAAHGKPAATLTLSARRHGRTVSVSGRVRASGVAASALRGAKVTLRLLSGKRVLMVKRVRAGRAGRFTARIRTTKRTRLTLRGTVSATKSAGASRATTARVR